MKKPFKETKVGQWLAEKKPDILNSLLDMAGNAFPPAKLITGLLKSKGATPEELAEFDQLAADYELERFKLSNEALSIVNATMQAEAKSEHWMQWSWRPAVGFLFVLIGISNYVLLPYLKKYGLQTIEIPSEMFMAILAILGVASWHRGVKKVEEVKAKK